MSGARLRGRRRLGGALRRPALWAAVAVLGLEPASGQAAIKRVWSIAEWDAHPGGYAMMSEFTELDAQRAGIDQVAGFGWDFIVWRWFGTEQTLVSGGAHTDVAATPLRFWMRDEPGSPWEFALKRYGVGVSVWDGDSIDDDPAELSLILYGRDDRKLGEVSVVVPPAEANYRQISASARFLGAVSSERVFSWEFRSSSSNRLGLDDMRMMYLPLPVPEPRGSRLALLAAAVAAACVARRSRQCGGGAGPGTISARYARHRGRPDRAGSVGAGGVGL